MQIMTVGSCGPWYVRLLTVIAGIRALSLLWRICLTSVPAPCRYGCSHNNMPLCPLGLALYAYRVIQFSVGRLCSPLCQREARGDLPESPPRNPPIPPLRKGGEE